MKPESHSVCVCFKYSNGRKCLHCEKSEKKKGVAKIDSQTHKKLQKFYVECWESMPHVCAETGERLPEYNPSHPKYSYLVSFHVAHILPKSKYPQLMYDKSNVILLNIDSHSKMDWLSVKGMKIEKFIEQRRADLLELITNK